MKLFPQAGPIATSCSLSPGVCRVVLAVASGPSDMGHHGERGATCRAGPSRGGHKNVFHKPRRQWERTKEFQGNSIYSRVRSKLQARLKMCCYSDIPNSCPHIACTVPPTPDTQSFLHFPRAFNIARMHKIALFFNNTETFEHCISRIPSREL